MLPSKLLRFKDLTCVGISNWPTLKRRVERDNFPPGRYLGENTRVWTEEEVVGWWNSRPKADPPDITKPAAPGGTGNSRTGEINKHPSPTNVRGSVQAGNGRVVRNG